MRDSIRDDKAAGEGVGGVTLWPHTGALLVGGKSRRMGEPKAAVTLSNGEIMGERIASLLARLCREVVLVGSGEHLPPGLEHLPLLSDRWEMCGPLGGLEALLASGRDDKYLVLPCDLPLLPLPLLRSLVRPTDAAPALFSLPGAKRPEPFPLLIPSGAHPRLLEELRAGRRSARAFLESLSPRLVNAPAGTDSCFESLNSLEQIRDPGLADRLSRASGGVT
ncbi:MAG: NTP transferase domain-containing protein [Candidatus Eisenbacteria bacterium]